jgi:predicted kinase
MEELENLYNVISGEGLYTKSFDEFKTQFSDATYQDKVFKAVSEKGFYTKDINSFKQKYVSKTLSTAGKYNEVKKDESWKTNENLTSEEIAQKDDEFIKLWKEINPDSKITNKDLISNKNKEESRKNTEVLPIVNTSNYLLSPYLKDEEQLAAAVSSTAVIKPVFSTENEEKRYLELKEVNEKASLKYENFKLKNPNLFKSVYTDQGFTTIADYSDENAINKMNENLIFDFIKNNKEIQDVIIPNIYTENEKLIGNRIKELKIKYGDGVNFNTKKDYESAQSELNQFVSGFIFNNKRYTELVNDYSNSINELHLKDNNAYTVDKHTPDWIQSLQLTHDNSRFSPISPISLYNTVKSMQTGMESQIFKLQVKYDWNERHKIFERNKQKAVEDAWTDETIGFVNKQGDFKKMLSKRDDYRIPTTWGEARKKMQVTLVDNEKEARKDLMDVMNKRTIEGAFKKADFIKFASGENSLQELSLMTSEQLPNMVAALISFGTIPALTEGASVYETLVMDAARKEYGLGDNVNPTSEQMYAVLMADTENKIADRATMTGGVIGALEYVGARAAVPVFGKAAGALLAGQYKLALKASINSGQRMALGGFTEGLTEGLQTVASSAATGNWDSNEFIQAIGMGTTMGIIMPFSGSVVTQTKRELSESIKIVVNKYDKHIIDATFNNHQKLLDKALQTEQLSKEEHKEKTEAINSIRNNSTKIPKNLNEEQKTKSLDLLIEKENLEKEIENKDKNLVIKQVERVEVINNQLQKISTDAQLSSVRVIAEQVEKEGGVKINIKIGNTKDQEKYLIDKDDDLVADISFNKGFVSGMKEIVKDPNSTSQEIEEANAYLEALNMDKTESIKPTLDIIKGQSSNYGSMIPIFNESGNVISYDLFINEETSFRDGMLNTAAHEMFHAVIFGTLQNNKDAQMTMGRGLIEAMNSDGIKLKDNSTLEQRINQYSVEEGLGEEIMALTSEAALNDELDINETGFDILKNVFRRFSQKHLGVIGGIKFNTNKDVLNFIKDYNKSIQEGKGLNRAMLNVLTKGAKGKLTETATDTKAGGTKFSKFSALESINNLIPSDVKTKEDYQEFVQDRKRFAPLGKALEENGVISNYVKSKSVGDEYVDAMESVTDRVIGLRGIFNPERLREDGTKVGKEAFGEFIFANTNFAKRDAKKALAIRKIESDKTTSIDTKEAREIEDQSTIDESTSGRSDGDTKKINVLKFTGVSSKINELMNVVDIMPVGNNTFKTVDEYTGKAAEIIFDIPAEKATKGNKNLSHRNRVVNGMVELSQAGKIQNFYRVEDNLEKIVKIMVPENVTQKTGDISEVGENVDVARDIYGRSIGLKGKVLEYFFNKTGKRSQGLTTQPNVWELKPEFKNPSKETLDKLRSDLGITPQGQANVSDRAFNGQLLKGIAEYQAYQTALSITQRKLDAVRQKAATQKEKSAISQDIANVTAAQSRFAFSKSLAGKIYNDSQIKHGSLSGRVFGVIGTTKITYASAKRNPDGTIRWKTKSVRDLFGWWSDNETGEQARNRVANNFLSVNPQYRDILRNTMSGGETISLFKTKDKFDSAINSTNVEQSTINRFHYNKKKLLTKSALEKIRTKEFKANELAKTVVGKQFWLAVQSHLKNNPDDVWFFEEMLVDSQNNQGAITRIIALFTSYPVDKKGQPVFNREVIEEHSSPQIKMARISLAAAKDGNIDDVWPVIEASYMQMSLLASDDAKVRATGLSSNLPDIFWKEIVPRILDGSLNWLPKGYASFSRYAVAGVDLNGYELLSGETVTEFFGVSDIKHIDGSHNIKLQNDIILGILTGKFQLGYGQSIANVNLSKENSSNAINSSAISFSRTANPAKGISVLDFDDTLATTKSGVRYTLPNPDGTPQPKKKVIFMAGGPGSGKSNVINQLGLKEQGFKVVNQDISLEWLMKNHGMPTDMREFTPEQASEFGKLSAQAREIALKKRIKYQGEGDGVVIDGTGASLNVMKKNIQDFKDKGYDVQMIFVETSQETALSRNKARKERSLRTGIVIKTHDSVQANKEAYRELFGERFAEVNTDNLKQGDAMPDDLSIKVNDFTSGYIKGRLNAGEYATKGEELRQQGAEFDFSEFNQVVEGRTAPLFNKAMKLQEKFTSKDMFVLTARPAESNQAIFEFLQANGLNIPMENIIGLGSSCIV